MISLKNKCVLITGGSRGIGEACVRLFAKADADVAFTFNSAKESAEKIISELNNSSRVKSYKVSLLNEKEIKASTSSVLNDFGKINILVNNAGIWKGAAIDEMSLEQWNETISINLSSAFYIQNLLSLK